MSSTSGPPGQAAASRGRVAAASPAAGTAAGSSAPLLVPHGDSRRWSSPRRAATRMRRRGACAPDATGRTKCRFYWSSKARARTSVDDPWRCLDWLWRTMRALKRFLYGGAVPIGSSPRTKGGTAMSLRRAFLAGSMTVLALALGAVAVGADPFGTASNPERIDIISRATAINNFVDVGPAGPSPGDIYV